jgi:uncharacterized protein (AIM24 family)
MVWKDAAIQMSTVFGDGRGAEGGFMGKLLGAGKRLVTGESLFTTVFTHQGQGKARVAFSAPVPGAILPIKLDTVGGTLICQKDSFLAAAKGVSTSSARSSPACSAGKASSCSASRAMAGCSCRWAARLWSAN